MDSDNAILSDSTKWLKQTETYAAHFDKLMPPFKTLEGKTIDMRGMYSEYLLLWAFTISGRSNLTAIPIRETIRDVEKLNQEFGDRIQIVLINADQMDWMVSVN
jgi:hypothetical protein